MKQVKRMLAVLLAVLLTFAVVGCHPKNEIAVTIKGEEFTSAYYMCALIYADMEGRQMVDAELAEKEKDKADSEKTKEVDYTKQKIEGKKFSKWVKARALENLKSITAYKVKCKDAKITIPEEELATTQTYAEYYWSSYGYAQMFEPNGVGKATFTTYMTDAIYAELYFEHLYGKGGEKEIAADQLNKQLADNYVLVNMLEVSFANLGEEEKTDKQNQFIAYENALKDGTKTFEEIYIEYNKISAEEHTHEEAEEGKMVPIDQHATVLGNADTNYASDHFETAKEMTVGDVKIITLEKEAGLVLLVKQDIAADPYYINEFDSTLRKEVVGEEHSNDIAEYGEKLDCVVNESSIKQFKVKKIEYPEATN